MRVRTDDHRRIPIPPQRRLALALLRLQHQLLPCRLVVANQHPILRLRINRVRIDRIHRRPEAVSPGGHKPVRIHNAVDVVRARRSAPRKIVLRSAAHVIEGKRVVHRHVVELHRRQVRFEFPVLGIVPGFIHSRHRSPAANAWYCPDRSRARDCPRAGCSLRPYARSCRRPAIRAREHSSQRCGPRSSDR